MPQNRVQAQVFNTLSTEGWSREQGVSAGAWGTAATQAKPRYSGGKLCGEFRTVETWGVAAPRSSVTCEQFRWRQSPAGFTGTRKVRKRGTAHADNPLSD